MVDLFGVVPGARNRLRAGFVLVPVVRSAHADPPLRCKPRLRPSRGSNTRDAAMLTIREGIPPVPGT